MPTRDPGLGRMVLASLVVHLLALALFSGVLIPHLPKEVRPVYYVDLVHRPVKDPRAGRPDAAVEPSKAPNSPAAKAEPAVQKPEPVVQKAETVKVAAPKTPIPAKPAPKTEPKPAPKPQPKPTPKAPAKALPPPKPQPVSPPAASYEEDTLSAIDKLRRRQEIETAKARIAELARNDTRSAPIAAPVGMVDGKGREAGVDQGAYIQAFIRENWSFSLYQLAPGKRPESVEARVLIIYNADGSLADYRILSPSGDANFDLSLKKALLKSKQLPRAPLNRLEVEATFNLKDMIEAQR